MISNREMVSITSSIVFDFATLDTTLLVILFQVVRNSSNGGAPKVSSFQSSGVKKSLVRQIAWKVALEVTEGGGTTASTSVDIFKTSHLHKLLWDWTADETSTTWGWDETDVDGTTFTVDLTGDSVWSTELV